MEIVMERVILNVTEPADRWVAGYAAIIATPEDTYVLQARTTSGAGMISQYTGPTPIMCALWAHTTTGMESVASWWCQPGDVSRELSALMQREMEVVWQN